MITERFTSSDDESGGDRTGGRSLRRSLRGAVGDRGRNGTLALATGGITLLRGLRALRGGRSGGMRKLLVGGGLVAIGLTQRRHKAEQGTPAADDIESGTLDRQDERTSIDEAETEVDRTDEEPTANDGGGAEDVPGVDDDLADEADGSDDLAETDDREGDDDREREATNDVIDQIDDEAVVPSSDTVSPSEPTNAGQGRTGNTRPIAESEETPAPSDDDVPVDEDLAEPTESPVGTSVDEDPSREDEGMEAIGEGMTGEDDQSPMADDSIGEAEGKEVVGEAADEELTGEMEADRVTDEAEAETDDDRVNREDDVVGGGETEEMDDPSQIEELVEGLEEDEAESELGEDALGDDN